MIRVLIAEDQAMVRGALASLLSLEPDIEVVAEVDRGDEVLAAATRTQPDVALLDIEMPGRDGITAGAELVRALKLGARNRGEAIAVARDKGWL
jgi:two-component system response regulator DesR